jgi:hypothetical protein
MGGRLPGENSEYEQEDGARIFCPMNIRLKSRPDLAQAITV